MKLNKLLFVIALFCLTGCEQNNQTTSSSDRLVSSINEGNISVVALASWLDDVESKIIQEKYPSLGDKIHVQYNEKYKYLSNTNEQRFYFLKQALDNKASSVIWALRGGGGSERMIPYLLNIQKPTVHKWLIGDHIMALHLFVSQVWGWKSILGAGARETVYSAKDPKNFIYLEKILSGIAKPITYQGLKLKPIPFIKGKLRGWIRC